MIRKLVPLLFIGLYASLLHAGGSVDYTVNGESYEGYFSAPDNEPGGDDGGGNPPLILLLHDWDGLTGYEQQRAEMLTREGYAVFAADLFGKGVRPTEVKDKRQHTGELYQDREKLRALMQGAVKAAAEQGGNPDQMVVMGYCFGGAAALEYARAGFDARGVVSFHGGLGTPEGQNYETAKGKILIFHGSADANITLGNLAELGGELETAKVPHELISYGGAPHGFTVFDSGAYHKEADARSWARFLGFLKTLFPAK